MLDLRGRTGPRSSQVAHALIDAIAGGQIHDGDRLPSTRDPGRHVRAGPDRRRGRRTRSSTAAGFLVARPGGSTYVEHGAAAAARAGAFGAAPVLPPARDRAARRSPVTYDLRPGYADTGLISDRDWTRAMRLAAVAACPGATPATCANALSGYLRQARGLAVAAGRHLPVPERGHGAQGSRGQLRAGRPAGRVRGPRLRQGPARAARGRRGHPAGAGRRRRDPGRGPAGQRPGLLRDARRTSSRWAAGCR